MFGIALSFLPLARSSPIETRLTGCIMSNHNFSVGTNIPSCIYGNSRTTRTPVCLSQKHRRKFRNMCNTNGSKPQPPLHHCSRRHYITPRNVPNSERDRTGPLTARAGRRRPLCIAGNAGAGERDPRDHSEITLENRLLRSPSRFRHAGLYLPRS